MNNIIYQPKKNHQVMAQANLDDRQYSGLNTLRISENYNFGSEAIKYLEEKYNYLKKNNRFNLTGSKFHPHPYAAFCRKHFNQTIVCGCACNETIIDVGGHLIRTETNERIWLGAKQKWVETVHSMVPTLDYQDEIRHRNWEEILRSYNPPLSSNTLNNCNTKATKHGLCQCLKKDGVAWSKNSTLISIDSAYYPGVFEGIERTMYENDNSAYFAFHDYKKAIVQGKFNYYTFDKESHVVITQQDNLFKVTSQVNMNPFPYVHNVIDTADGRAWYVKVTGYKGMRYVVYQIIDNLKQSEHDYILVKAFIINSEPKDLINIPETHRFLEFSMKTKIDEKIENLLEQSFQLKDFIKISEMAERFGEMSTEVLNCFKSTLKLTTTTVSLIVKFAHFFKKKKCEKSLLKYEKKNGKDYVSLTCRCDYDDFDSEYQTYTCRSDYLSYAYVNLIGSYEVAHVIRIQARLGHMMNQEDPNTTNFVECVDATSMALLLIATDSMKLYRVVHINKIVQRAKAAARGIFPNVNSLTEWWRDKIKYLSVYKRPLIKTLIPFVHYMLVLYVILWWFPRLGVKAQEGTCEVGVKFDPTFLLVGATFLTKFFLNIKEERLTTQTRLRSEPRQIKGNCVVNKDRLDLIKNQGRTPAKWKFRDKDWDIRNMTGEEAFNYLDCDKQDKTEAVQIGPIIRGYIDRIPVIKHSCKRTQMAAAIRACSNKITADPDIYTKFVAHFASHYQRRLIQSIKEAGPINIDFNEWLQKYPQQYRDKMIAILDDPIMLHDNHYYTYDAFPKKEFQYCKVPSDLINTPLNDLKERQICGPPDEKKIVANALINELEKIADRCEPYYCGRKNWDESCSAIMEHEKHLINPEYGFSDFSGLDLTLVRRYARLFTGMMKQINEQCKNITFPYQLTNKMIDGVFSKSETIKVNVNRGSVTYETEGRASGDGWTSFANTSIVIGVWEFIFDLAEIPENARFLYVKGDDSLFCIEKEYKEQLIKVIEQILAKENTLKTHGLGLVVKFVKWGKLTDGDFLSNYFFNTPNGYRMTRIPSRVLQTISYSLKAYTHDKLFKIHSRQLLFSKGCSLLAWAHGLPIFDKLARKMISMGHCGSYTDYNEYSDGNRVWNHYDDRDYQAYLDWLNIKYGVTPEEVKELEDIIDDLDDQLDEVISPLVDKFYDVD